MDELPLNRASNPFKNQGFMLRLARQRGGGMDVVVAVVVVIVVNEEAKEEEESFRPPRCRYLEL